MVRSIDGGRVMMVAGYSGNGVLCNWFDANGGYRSGAFDSDTLRRVE
ncbi:MAG: DUF2158 domain-containing protein [Rhodospirillales bacterium]